MFWHKQVWASAAPTRSACSQLCPKYTHKSRCTHTHTSPHIPPQSTPGKALIQTKRLLLAKAKARLQRPQQSLFIAEAFNTTTILGAQKSCSNSTSLIAQSISEHSPARQLWVCCLVRDQLKPPSLESQPEATCAPLRIHNLFDSSNARLQGIQIRSVWWQE